MSGVDVAANVAAVRRRIAEAAARCGRTAAEVRLIAVAKMQSATLVRDAVAAGVCDIGESYVQEAMAKHAVLHAQAIRWHLIGHLQRNKAARAVQVFDVVHTVDSPALAAALARHATARTRPLPVLIEVNVAGESSKSGIAPAALPAVLDAVHGEPSLALEGLMTIPPADEPEEARRVFRALRQLRDAAGLRELSMGMSDDFEIAIEEGATMVRVGRAIFGARSA